MLKKLCCVGTQLRIDKKKHIKNLVNKKKDIPL